MNTISKNLPLITIICAVHNEEECIPLFFERLKPVVVSLTNECNFELIFTNNNSDDTSLEKILAIREKEPWVQVITLSRNFGYSNSLMSGLQNATGDAIVIIDVDCEDPPEMIPQFVEKWKAGYDIVYGERTKRNEAKLIQLARKFFYRITKKIADNDFVLDMAEFSLFTHEIKEVIVYNRSTYPFIRAEIGYAGFQRFGIPYTREDRISGKTHYNFWRMTMFAVGAMLSSSTFPFRFVVYSGVPIVLLNLIVLLRVLFGVDIDLRPLITLNTCALLVAAMISSIYIARIYKDAVRRPLFIVDKLRSYMNREPVNFNSVSNFSDAPTRNTNSLSNFHTKANSDN